MSGVGQGAQVCDYDCALPIKLKAVDGRIVQGTFKTPTLAGDSPLPALLGLQTLRQKGAVIDFRNLTLTMCGPDDRPLQYPLGSDTFQLEQSPSGHCMLPCCNYDEIVTEPTGIVLMRKPDEQASSSSQTPL